jgi:hypothetical protein
MARNRASLAWLLVLLLLLLGGCSSSDGGPSQGHALVVPNPNGETFKIRVGQEFAYDSIYLRNDGEEPITLKSAELLPDADLGGRVDTRRIVVAPLNDAPNSRDTTPGGIFASFPPTMQFGGKAPCIVQRIEALDGYVLAPGRDARIIFLMEPTKTGPFDVMRDRITYTESGDERFQLLPNELHGHTTNGPTDLEPTDGEKACADLGNLL